MDTVSKSPKRKIEEKKRDNKDGKKLLSEIERSWCSRRRKGKKEKRKRRRRKKQNYEDKIKK